MNRWFKDIEPGDRVRIKGGAFGNREGVVLRCRTSTFQAGTPPVVYAILVEVRAFGGRAAVEFRSPCEVERLPHV